MNFFLLLILHSLFWACLYSSNAKHVMSCPVFHNNFFFFQSQRINSNDLDPKIWMIVIFHQSIIFWRMRKIGGFDSIIMHKRLCYLFMPLCVCWKSFSFFTSMENKFFAQLSSHYLIFFISLTKRNEASEDGPNREEKEDKVVFLFDWIISQWNIILFP